MSEEQKSNNEKEQKSSNEWGEGMQGIVRKASESTMEMAQCLRESLPEQSNEQYDEEEYNNLSSGVYQVEQGEGQLSRAERGNSEQHPVRQEEEIVDSDQEHRLCEKQSEEELPEEEYMYPSLMEESQLDNQQSPKQPACQKKQESKVELSERKCEEELLGQEDQESMKKRSEQEESRRNIPTSEELFRGMQREEPKKEQSEEKECPLIELEERGQSEQREKEVGVGRGRFVRRRYEEAEGELRPQPRQEMPRVPTVRIIGYEKEYFLKVETQVYQIQYLCEAKSYIFCRRYSQFAALHKMLGQQFPGLVLYPFPKASLDLFRRIKLSLGQERAKLEAIELRLLELERYLGFIFGLKELRQSQIVEVFVAESADLFRKQFTCLGELLDKEEERFVASALQKNYTNLKSMVKSSFSLISSYVGSSSVRPINDHSAAILELSHKSQQLQKSFEEVRVQLQKFTLICSNLAIKVEKLAEIYRSGSQFRPIQSSIDSVVILSTKISASRTYLEQQQSWLEDSILSRVYYYSGLLEQVKEMVDYRGGLLQRVGRLGHSQEEVALGQGLVERAQAFDGRFLSCWERVSSQFVREEGQLGDSLCGRWREHCGLMNKIWR